MEDENGKEIKTCGSAGDDCVIASLKANQSLDVQDENEWTALHTYSHLGRTKVVKFLLDSGANPNIRDKQGRTPLHFAAMNNNLDLLSLFIRKEVNLDMKDNNGRTPLHSACRFGHVKHVLLLLYNGASAEIKDKTGKTPFHLTASTFKVEVLPVFLSRGVKIDEKDSLGRTALHWACLNNQFSNIQFLLENGADANARTVNGSTAMHYAASCSNTDSLDLLLKKGVNIDVQNDDGWTPLFQAVEKYQFDNVRFLIDRGAFLDMKNKHNGDTLLHIVVRNGCFVNFKILTYLLDNGALVGVRNNQNETAYKEFKSKAYNKYGFEDAEFHFVRHILKLKLLHFVDEDLPEDISLDEEEVTLYQTEIEQIKSTLVSKGFVLYEVIAQRGQPSYLFNKYLVEDLQTLFQSPDFLTKFPQYGIILQSQFRRSLCSSYFLGRQALSYISPRHRCFDQLPDDVWEKIFSFLDSHDIKNVIKVMSGK